jgi:hypothetical protein
MAQRFQVLVVCDLHADETPGTETVSFTVDGASYELDVCDQHASEVRNAFAPYVGAGRRIGRNSGSGGRRRRGGRSTGGIDPAAVRAWARSSNIAVSERGRISADVLAQYSAARK